MGTEITSSSRYISEIFLPKIIKIGQCLTKLRLMKDGDVFCDTCKYNCNMHQVSELIPAFNGYSNKKDGYRQLNVRQLGSLRPCDSRGKCYMDRKRIQCLSNASQHVHIYLRPFTSYSEILVGNRNFFLAPLHLTPPYGVAPGTITVNVTRLERGFNACKTPRCVYPSIFNRFPVIQAGILKVRHFSTFLHILASLCTPLRQSRKMLHGSNENSMLVKRLTPCTHLSSTVSEI